MKKIFTAVLFSLPLAFSYAKMERIKIQNGQFSQSDITINKGDTIRFEWVNGTHPVATDTKAWDTFTLNGNTPTKILVLQPGVYDFYCTLHDWMTGTITVNDVVSGFEVPSFAEAVSVYPNPAQQELNINNESGAADRVKLISVKGEEVLSQDLFEGANRLNLNLESGNYLMLLERRGEVVNRKKIQIAE
jgi:hypothetical protein